MSDSQEGLEFEISAHWAPMAAHLPRVYSPAVQSADGVTITVQPPRAYSPTGARVSAPVPQTKPLTKDDVVSEAAKLGATYEEKINTTRAGDYLTGTITAHDGLDHVAMYPTYESDKLRSSILHWLKMHNVLFPYAKPARIGINDAPRVACKRKPDTHGFHPQNEKCPYCP